MRSLVDHPMKEPFRYSGLTDEEMTRMLELVNLFKIVISQLDQPRRSLTATSSATQLASLQSIKEESLIRSMNEFMPKIVGINGAAKVRSFLNSRVKRRTKKISYAGHDVYVFCNV